MGEIPVIAVLNSVPELVELVKEAIEEQGFRAIGDKLERMKQNPNFFRRFLVEHDPKVIVIDIPIIYEQNYRLAKKLMKVPEAVGRAFVLTTTNKQRLEEIVGPTTTFELVGKPYDLNLLTQTIVRLYQSSHY